MNARTLRASVGRLNNTPIFRTRAVLRLEAAEKRQSSGALAGPCRKTICSAHFVASLCRTLCRTVRFLAVFDKVGRQSARQRSRPPFRGTRSNYGAKPSESARGLAQSKTLLRGPKFQGPNVCEKTKGALHEPAFQ